MAFHQERRPEAFAGLRSHGQRIWLQCPTCGYEWRESLRGTRKESRKCPSCHGGRGHYLAKGSNDLGSKRPDVARQLDPELNGGLRAEDLHAHAGAMVWWRGPCGHVWREKVSMRFMCVDDSCPYCSGRKVLAGFNDLAITHPGIAAMWHPRMSKRLKPAGVQATSRKPAWWRGECGHVYQMAVRDRARAKPGYCPYCSGRKRPERPIRLDQPSAPRRGRNGGGVGASCP